MSQESNNELALLRLRAKSPKTIALLDHIKDQLFSSRLTVTHILKVTGAVSSDAKTFRAEIGETPKELIERLRLSAGKRLLLATNLPVWRIATMVGYSDFGVFGKALFRREGVRPMEFRRVQGHRVKDSDFLTRAAAGHLRDDEARILVASLAELYPQEAVLLGLEVEGCV